MTLIRDNLQIIGAKLEKFAHRNNRLDTEVKLLAVSKHQSANMIREAYQAGQRAFGENYVQELIDKDKELGDLDIEWHFIGPLQSNKTKKIAETVNWVHTIDRLKIAKRLNDQRPDYLEPLSVCIQINISGEDTKSGIYEKDLFVLAKEIIKLPSLQLKGLMVIPAPQSDMETQRKVFAKVSTVKQELNQLLSNEGVELDTLSMGMSNDMEAAVAEGATIVRIGTAIFGERQY